MSDAHRSDDRQPGNRLLAEKSPYLLQHAHNPVDWYPWGEEAFAAARRRDCPIFLSIGYSTCHWCHVMERESFESDEVAAVLNRDFVCIKVDREERPDVDRMYMATVQAITGSGGWPLSVWLTPDLEPFYAGTYFPPDGRYGRPGFVQVLGELARIWREDRGRAVDSGRRLVTALRDRSTAGGGGSPLDRAWLATGADELVAQWDRVRGGFGSAPKFPRPCALSYLLREHVRAGRTDLRDAATGTLLAMWRGGVYDQLGGGLHRYSVDAQWRVPHFEKMLYDQAQLVTAALEARQVTGDPRFAAMAADVLDYVRRELGAPEGGFWSAEDADSALSADRPEVKQEGAFYLWEKREVEDLLGAEDAEAFALAYGIRSDGNTLHDPHGELGTRNVLYRALAPEAVAERLGRSPAEVEDGLARSREMLLAARACRPRPHLDDKVLTAWNGLAISAFARAYQVSGCPADLASAQSAASFLRSRLVDLGTGHLRRRYREGEARFEGQLDDYAFLVQGLVDLYEADFDVEWLLWAESLLECALGLFSADGGALYDSVADPSVLVRTQDLYDGAEPSGNAVAALDLQRLAWLLGRSEWLGRAEGILGSAADVLRRAPQAAPCMLAALDFLVGAPVQVVVAGAAEDPATQALLAVVWKTFSPRKVVLRLDGGAAGELFRARHPFLAELGVEAGRASAHVCRDFSCALPTTDPEVLARQLEAGNG